MMSLNKLRAEPSASPKPTPIETVAERRLAIDFVKGVLVIVMIIYHTMNIFTTAGSDDYAYVRFVSGSFIQFSGYMAAKGALNSLKAKRWLRSRKLLIRGLKLVVLFCGLNLAIALTGVGNPTKAPHGSYLDASTLLDVFVVGEPQSASFQILLPIGYSLILAPTILRLRRYALPIFVACMVMVLIFSFVESNSVNLEFMLLAAMSMTGCIFLDRVGISESFGNAGLAAISLVAAVLFTGASSAYLLPYALGIVAILKSLYDFGSNIDMRRPLARACVLLGQYSLLGYISQIIFLQLLARLMGRPKFDLGVDAALICCITAVILLALCASLETLRRKSTRLNSAYRLVFA